MEAATYTSQGTERDRVTLPEAVFDGTVNTAVMHQAVKAYLANQRQGTHATKTRGLVTGGNQKPWRQKGTGRARQGSTRAPHWPGGGTVFGPIPRSYNQDVPRKVKMLARKSAFNARARENSLFVIDAFDYDAPKTSRLRSLLSRLEIDHRNVLVLTDGIKRNVYLSGRNLPNVQVMPYDDASTYHVLWAHVVLVEGGALGHKLDPIAEKEPSKAVRRARPAKAAAKSEESEKKAAAGGSKRKAAARGATRKKAPAAKKKKAPAKKAAGARKSAGAAKKTSVKKSAAKSASRTRKKEK